MNNCMNKYKNDFAIKFAQLMEKELPYWKRQQRECRAALYGGWVWLYLGAFAAGFLPGKHETDYFNNLKMHFWLGVFFCIVSIITAIDFENKDYQKRIKKKLFPKLLKVFAKQIQYPGIVINPQEYDKSLLLKKPVSRRLTDDCFSGVYNGVPFKIEETELRNVKPAKRKKDEEETSLFKGVAMHFEMEKEIKARVLISTKLLCRRTPKGYEKVTLEYEKFNKKYNVYVQNSAQTQGQIEARYLFNTAFLERFMQIQTSFSVRNMECSICGKELLFLLHTGKDLFEMNHLFGRVDDVRQYEKLFNEFASVLSFIEVLNLSSKTRL